MVQMVTLMVRSVHLTLIQTIGGELRQAYWFPSLLAAAYFQLYRHLIGGGLPRFRRNPSCRLPFIAERATKVSCSDACAGAVRQRRLRKHVQQREK